MQLFAELTPLADVKDLLTRKFGKLWTPGRSLYTPTEPGQGKDLMVFDPVGVGYDGKLHQTAGILTQEGDTAVYSSGGAANINLRRNRVITGLGIVADPYRHDVTTATITVVQDAVDKLLSGLNIAGGPTYFAQNSTTFFLKPLGNLQKLIRPGMEHDDLATGVGADNDSYQAWHIGFGVFDDMNPFDFSAGIPAQDEDSLVMGLTFATDQLIAETAANGTIDTATTLYVLTYGVQGLSPRYRKFLPLPAFEHSYINSPTTNVSFNLRTGRRLKRTTIINLAVAASNNNPRNDANITDVTFAISKPVDTRVFDTVRWRTFRGGMTAWYLGTNVDKDGSAAVIATGLPGITVIDWRTWTGNPFGLNLYGYQDGDVQLQFTMGTTTGAIALFNEYYSLPAPRIADLWDRRPYHRP